jgi:hypothetical protein
MEKDVRSLQGFAQQLFITDISPHCFDVVVTAKRAAVDERPDLEAAADERLDEMAADEP